MNKKANLLLFSGKYILLAIVLAKTENFYLTATLSFQQLIYLFVDFIALKIWGKLIIFFRHATLWNAIYFIVLCYEIFFVSRTSACFTPSVSVWLTKSQSYYFSRGQTEKLACVDLSSLWLFVCLHLETFAFIAFFVFSSI